MLSEVLRRARLVAALGLVACVVCTPAPASPLPPWCEYVNEYLKKLRHCCYSKKFKKSEKNEIWREVMKFLDEEEPEDFVVVRKTNCHIWMTMLVQNAWGAKKEQGNDDWKDCRDELRYQCQVFTTERWCP
ncbi:MAG: hypothetical protein OXC07_10450 [Kistimonas sp.]|nr:hypothetical protein [Kistimonas sp.]